ncbi:MAG TPA: methionyl-tRNA formyltransferase, partial [Chloroflexota bacterium]|nr:methionyl-tRNA formyltransferase [Chloroflexota bacterium]
LAPPPVKRLALAHDLPVLQPVSLRRPVAVRALQRFRPDLGIVAAYGKILRPDVLLIPKHGHLNVHASLLPRWRGAWPIGAAILAGDDETGVTIMRLDEGMDTGPILAHRSEPIAADDTTETLERRLARLGAELLVETLPAYLGGSLEARAQDDSRATYCRTVGKGDGRIDWSRSAPAIERQVRAMTPWPGAHTTWEGKQLRIVRARVGEATFGHEPGAVVAAGKLPAVATGDGTLVLDELQLEGRPPTAGTAFVNGYRAFIGSRLGTT